MSQIIVRPQGFLGRLGDALMLPVMWVLQGFALESPQRTHRWNNTKFRNGELNALDRVHMVCTKGSTAEKGRWSIGHLVPMFHMPIFGGWIHYVVLSPEGTFTGNWYVGWIADDVTGISRVPVPGYVRVLRGPKDAAFFGIDAATGEQIKIRRVGFGIVGRSGPWRNTPLL